MSTKLLAVIIAVIPSYCCLLVDRRV